MLFVFWAVTPLQSAIFNIGPVTRSVSSLMITSSTLIPLDQQSNNLDISILNVAYAISWLGQRLPPFTTSQYAAVPFQPLQGIGSQTGLPSEIWTTSANIFSTSLLCSPARVSLASRIHVRQRKRLCRTWPAITVPTRPRCRFYDQLYQILWQCAGRLGSRESKLHGGIFQWFSGSLGLISTPLEFV